jgi:hypothetical protein
MPSSKPLKLTCEQKELVLLSIAAEMGGRFDSGDYSWSWLNWFCDDSIDGTDTFNRCHDKKWLCTSHETSTDESVTSLTDAGRAALKVR